MSAPILTPVQHHADAFYKRDDFAGMPVAATGLGARTPHKYLPSGSKVRQFNKMLHAAPPDAELIVACASTSCMQVYLAAAGKLHRRPAHIFVPKKKVQSAATAYAVKAGAIVHYETPAYMNVLRARARTYRQAHPGGKWVQWDAMGAIQDAAEQVTNIPKEVRYIVVPVGSGLVAAGVLAGVAMLLRSHHVRVIGVAVSPLATRSNIIANALKITGKLLLPKFKLIAPTTKYDKPVAVVLNGSILDPYYAAKAAAHMKHDGTYCLWVSGVRPWAAMPPVIRKRYPDEEA